MAKDYFSEMMKAVLAYENKLLVSGERVPIDEYDAIQEDKCRYGERTGAFIPDIGSASAWRHSTARTRLCRVVDVASTPPSQTTPIIEPANTPPPQSDPIKDFLKAQERDISDIIDKGGNGNA